MIRIMFQWLALLPRVMRLGRQVPMRGVLAMIETLEEGYFGKYSGDPQKWRKQSPVKHWEHMAAHYRAWARNDGIEPDTAHLATRGLFLHEQALECTLPLVAKEPTMLSISRAAGESLDLFVDYDRNPRLVALVERLGGDAGMLADLADRVTVKYTHHTDKLSGGLRLAQPEVFLAIAAPQHVAIWRTEKLRKELRDPAA